MKFLRYFSIFVIISCGGGSGGNFDSNQLDPTKFCNNEQCTNLSEPDKGRFLIDYIEIKSID